MAVLSSEPDILRRRPVTLTRRGRLPDAAFRARMEEFYDAL
jgi:hypothetical protein